MSKSVTTVLILLIASTLSAQTPAPAPFVRDTKLDTLALDLHALDRIATLSKEFDDERQVMLAIVDANINALREPRDNGTYKWASLQREEGSRVMDEKSVEQVQTEKILREVTVSAPNAYRVLVTIPEKRNLISANNRVFVRNIFVDSTGFDGKTQHHEMPVNAWVNPGDSTGVALPEIGRTVKVTAELGVESGNKKAVGQVALLQAKLVDDPASPYFPAMKRLLQIHEQLAQKNLQRGAVKSLVDEALLSVPGELEKRAAEQRAAEDKRKLAAMLDTRTGVINSGDATPDVVAALVNVNRMLTGTLDEQSAARAQLKTLIDSLKPAQPSSAAKP